MKKTRFSIDQIIRILAEAETPGNSGGSVARKYGIVEQTIYRWRQKYKGFSASEVKRLKALEEENARLKLNFDSKTSILAISEKQNAVKMGINEKRDVCFVKNVVSRVI